MQIYFTVCFFFLGALFASFYNVIGIRVLEKRSLLGNSICPKCNHKLRLIDVFPLLGYLINRGKCHFCRAPIHIKYFLIELFGGALLSMSFWFLGFTLEFFYLFMIYSMLIIVSVSYYEYHKILNLAIYIFLPIALGIVVYLEVVNNTGILYKSFIGAGIVALGTYLLRFINPNNSKYLLFSIAVGFSINSEGLLLFIGVLVLGFLIRLFVKKIPPLYIVSLATIVSFVFTSSLIEMIL